VQKTIRRPKRQRQRKENLEVPPQKMILHDIAKEYLNALFEEENYLSMSDEICWRLRLCAEHDTNLTGKSPVTGIYR